MTTSAVVTSPWVHNGRPIRAIVSSTGMTLPRSRTPEWEFVVAPAGYSFTAFTSPEAAASATSAASVPAVR